MIFGFGSYPPKFAYEIPSKFHLRFPPIFVPHATKFSSFSSLCHKISESESIKMSDDSDSDFGFGSSSPFFDDDEPSTTTQESLVDGAHRQQQWQQEDIDAVIIREEDKDTEKQKENNNVPALNAEQDNEHSTTTQESVVDNGHGQEQQQDNEQSSTTQESGDDDENESGDDDENEAVIIGDDDNDNEEQAENEDNFEAKEQEEGCSGDTKKRRRFTLQEKLMYLRVTQWKVDRGLSLREASKSIHISHKQILNWKKQAGEMKNKNNQHAKSLGDGMTSFLSLYTDNLLSFIFKMRETGMAVSVNSIVLKVSQLSRKFREKTITARHSAVHRFINVHGFVHQMGTHLSQRQPSDMEEIATDFVCVTHEKLQMSCRDEAYIINMDQTPLPFSYDQKKLKWLDEGQFISGSQHPI